MIIRPEHAELITPGRAIEILGAGGEHNELNRTVREKRKKVYAASLRQGEWLLTGETVTRDVNGKIINGGHRLTTIAETGVPMLVFFIDGLESVTRVSLAELWEKYEEEIEDAAPAKLLVRTPVPVSSGAASFMWWLLRHNGSDPELIRKFFAIIADGSQDRADHGLVRLRKFLDTPAVNPKTRRVQKLSAKHEIWYLLLAWSDWLAPGEKPVHFKIPEGGVMDPYPKPVTAKQQAAAG